MSLAISPSLPPSASSLPPAADRLVGTTTTPGTNKEARWPVISFPHCISSVCYLGPWRRKQRLREGQPAQRVAASLEKQGLWPELSDPKASAPHTAFWSLRKVTRDCLVSPTQAGFPSTPHSSREQLPEHAIRVGPRMARRTRHPAEKTEGRSREGMWVHSGQNVIPPIPTGHCAFTGTIPSFSSL